MTRALENNLLAFSDEEGAEATCPVCKDCRCSYLSSDW